MLKVAKKYILSFPEAKEKEILDLLKKDWYFEIIDSKEIKEKVLQKLQETNYLISSLDFVISYLYSFSQKESFLAKIKNPKIIVKKEDFQDAKKQRVLNNFIDRVIEIEKSLKILENENRQKEEKIKNISHLRELTFVPRETDFVFSFIIKVEEKEEEAIKDFCFANKIYLNKLLSDKKKKNQSNFYSVLGSQEKKNEFLELQNFEIIAYEYLNIPSKEEEMELKNLKDNRKKQESLKKELGEIAKFLNDFKIYYDMLCLERRGAEVKKRYLAGDFLRYVVFWAGEEEMKDFEKKLKMISSSKEGAKIMETNLEEGEVPPVFLENSKLVAPFQAVTDIFGLPSHKEIDPTPYLALFFIIFFGICITDAGYGLLMMLFTGLPILFFKKAFGKSKLLKLLFYGGVFTFIAGVLFGSYFGVSAEDLGLPFMGRLRVIDPIKDTIIFLIFAFFLGYLQICFSQVVKMIKSCKNKDNQEFFSGFAWLGFYISLGVYLLSLKFDFLKTFGFLAIIIFLTGIFLVETKGQKIFLKPLIGFIKILQGLINTTSDILSYSRLMALGLGTGVIALIVNQIAFLFGGMIPYFGWLVALIILIGGHIFNLGINALGGFIHSSRLQFVEFFPKFLEGGGRRLDPINEELKYIKIINQ